MSAFSWIFSWIKNHFKKSTICCEQFNIGTNFLLSNYTQQLYQSAEERIHPPFRRGSWVQQRDITAKFFKCVFLELFPSWKKTAFSCSLIKKRVAREGGATYLICQICPSWHNREGVCVHSWDQTGDLLFVRWMCQIKSHLYPLYLREGRHPFSWYL